MADSAAWSRTRRLLAVRLDAMGDVLMTTPALRAIRCSIPDARLTLLTSSAGAIVGSFVPEIDEVISHDASWMKATPEPADPRVERDLVEDLRTRDFDAAVIFTVHSQSPLPAALLCRLAGIPLRLAHSADKPYQLLTDCVPDPERDSPIRHEVRRQLDLVASVGFTTPDEHLSFRIPPAAMRQVRATLPELGIEAGGPARPARPWAVIHPGASAPSRQYPVDRYGEVARRLADEAGWRLVVTGGAREASLGEAIVAAAPGSAVSLAGRLDLAQLAALLALAPLAITNNTGPAHLAAAVGTPLVDVYAATNPQHTPWGVAHRLVTREVPCGGCERSVCPLGHHDCLRTIDPDEVVAAARDLAAETRRMGGGPRLPTTDTQVAVSA